MVCSSGVGFDPVVDGDRLLFELTGVYNAVMVMSDRKTDTVWSHLTGEGLHGAHKGRQLAYVPTYTVTWKEWKRRHPRTKVLSLDPRYEKFYAPSGLGRKALGAGRAADGKTLSKGFRRSLAGPFDDRLKPNALVLGVAAGGASKAYPLEALGSDPLEDELGGTPILILAGGGGAMAFDRRLHGTTLTFDGRTDRETGTRWDDEGRGIKGKLKGEALRPVFAIVTEWYGWSLYRPDTALHEAETSPNSDD